MFQVLLKLSEPSLKACTNSLLLSKADCFLHRAFLKLRHTSLSKAEYLDSTSVSFSVKVLTNLVNLLVTSCTLIVVPHTKVPLLTSSSPMPAAPSACPSCC